MKEQIEAVQRMQDYIAAHLEERITLAALAGASLFSPWYCYRLFRQYTGLSPADYVRRLRLSHPPYACAMGRTQSRTWRSAWVLEA